MMTGDGSPDRPMFMLHVFADVVTGAEDIHSAQQRIQDLLFSLGGVTCKFSTDPYVGPDSADGAPASLTPELEFEQCLQMDIGTAIRTSLGGRLAGLEKRVTRAENLLGNKDIYTVRDVLAVGRKEIGDIRNMGQLTVELIGEALTSLNRSIVWHNRPTMVDIVRICPNLSDVPSAAVGMELSHVSIEDLLTLPIDTLAECFKTSFSTKQQDHENAFMARNKARAFARRFHAQKLQVAASAADERG